VQKGRGGENDSDPPISQVVLTAARGGDAPPRVLQFQKSSSSIPGFFRGYFVNLKLCNVIFVLLF